MPKHSPPSRLRHLQAGVTHEVVAFPMPQKHDWKWHRDRINEAWGSNQVEAIIEVGRRLIAAKKEIGHGDYEAMVRTELRFGPSVARRYKIIAEHQVISDRAHVHVLPPNWGTLYELTKIPNETLMIKLNDGTINPKLERKDVAAMRPGGKAKPKPKTQQHHNDPTPDVVRKMAEAHLDHRKTLEQVMTDFGMKSVTAVKFAVRHELGRRKGVAETETKLKASTSTNSDLTLEQLRKRIVPLLLALPKDKRRQEINEIMSDSQMSIHDFFTTMTIGLKGRK